MTHEFTGSAFVLAVHDLEEEAGFYRRTLGFQDLGVDAPGWCFMGRDACRVHLGACPDAIAPSALGDHSYFGYLYVDDAEACYDQARREGATIIKPLNDEPWGMREFGVRTPGGHRLMIGQRLPATA